MTTNQASTSKKFNYLKFLLIIIVGIIIFIFYCFHCYKNEKWLWEKTFLEKHPIYASKQMVTDGTSYTIDNYIITLEKYMYNKTSTCGHVVFSVKKKTFETKKDLKVWKANAKELFCERFSLSHFISNDGYYELDGTTLYIYKSFRQEYYDGKIDPFILEDKYQINNDPDSNSNFKEYPFPIISNVNTRAYKIGTKETIYLSPSSVIYEYIYKSNDQYDEDSSYNHDLKIIVHYKNGSTRKIIDASDKQNAGRYSFLEQYSNDEFHRAIHTFNNALNIDDIDYITVDNQKYSNFSNK